MEKLSCKSISALKDEPPEPPPFVCLISTPGFKFLPETIEYVRKHSFYGLPRENPDDHLCEFLQFSSLITNDKGLDMFMWKMFPYSLVSRAKSWYAYIVGSVYDSWDKLKDKFCCEFFSSVSSSYSMGGYLLFSTKREGVGK
jgi:hypothetical protein